MHDRRRVAIYTFESDLRRPSDLFRQMFGDLGTALELAWRLMQRDLQAQYRQSALGFVWALLPALATTIGFTLANRAQVLNIADTDIPYPAYVLLSTVLWQAFLASVTGPIQGAITAKAMISKVNFPREAIVLAKVGEGLVDFAIKMVPVAIVLAVYRVVPTASALLAPLAFLAMIAFGTILGSLLAPLGVLFGDVTRALTLISGGWMLLTPVVYPMPASGTFAAIVRLNPATPLLMTTRELLTTGNLTDPVGFAVVALAALLALLPAWIAFRLAMPYAIERVTS